MWLSLIFVILLFAVALRQATCGLFSAMIMTVLTLCCATLAIGMHEWVAVTLLAPYWKPDYAHAIAMGAVFGVPLIVVRVVVDKFVTRSCLLPSLVDRVGAGVCGLITAMTMVGVAALCVQMIPFGPSIIGFTRVPIQAEGGQAVAADESEEGASLWLGPDRFAVGVASLLSIGVFSGDRAFGQDNPDFVQACGWNGAVLSEVSRLTKSDSFSIARTTQPQFVYKMTRGIAREGTQDTFEPIPPEGGEEFRMIGVQLHDAARDSTRSHKFTLRQFRLVGRSAGSELPEQHHPIALQQEDTTQVENRHIKCVTGGGRCRPLLDDLFMPRDGSALIEIVFSLPKGFEPSFLEYKHGMRASVTFEAAEPARAPRPPVGGTPGGSTSGATGETSGGASAPVQPDATTATPAAAPPAPDATTTGSGATPPAPDGTAETAGGATDEAGSQPADAQPAVPTTTAADTPSESEAPADSGSTRRQRGSRRRGNVRRATAEGTQSFFGDKMAMELRSYRQLRNVDIVHGVLRDGHLAGEVDAQAGGTDPVVTRFNVPEDKRLLHLNTEFLQARSGIGRVLSQAIGTVQNYFVTDERGRQYKIVGKYAIADVNGRRMIEVQYYSTLIGSMGGLGKFDRIRDEDFKNDYRLVMLFHVDPGARIKAFSTGGDATRADDLSTQNLVAPQ